MTAPDSTSLPEVVMILRGLAPDRALPAAEALVEAGVQAIEITLNSPDAPASIAELTRRHGGSVLVGAGTVRTPEQVPRVADAGARFVLSPNTSPEVIAATKTAGLLSVPGAYTPSEIERAWRLGADVVKVFPIQPAGPGYLRMVRDPLDDVPMLASGGLTAALARDCLAAGCVSVGVGVGLLGVDPRTGDWPALTSSAKAYLAEVGRRSLP